MKLKIFFPIGSIVSPIKNFHGFNGSIRSKITFIMTVTGKDKNNPGTPHNAPPIKTTMIKIVASRIKINALVWAEVFIFSKYF